jgi:hypothetical protein
MTDDFLKDMMLQNSLHNDLNKQPQDEVIALPYGIHTCYFCWKILAGVGIYYLALV